VTVRIVLASSLLLTACVTPVETKVAELEVRVQSLTDRLDSVGADRDRLISALEQGVGAEATARARSDQQVETLATLEARVLKLTAELEEVRQRVATLEGVDQEGMDRNRQGPPVTISGGPEGARGAPPAGGQPLKVLSVGTGSLVLLQGAGGSLERVELAGVDAPLTTEEYADQPSVRERHARALGRRPKGYADWEASRAHLEAMLLEKKVTLSYPKAERRSQAAGLWAYLEIEGTQEDVNAAMIRDGFALASSGHERAATYLELEEQARAAKKGLFAAP